MPTHVLHWTKNLITQICLLCTTKRSEKQMAWSYMAFNLLHDFILCRVFIVWILLLHFCLYHIKRPAYWRCLLAFFRWRVALRPSEQKQFLRVFCNCRCLFRKFLLVIIQNINFSALCCNILNLSGWMLQIYSFCRRTFCKKNAYGLETFCYLHAFLEYQTVCHKHVTVYFTLFFFYLQKIFCSISFT